MQAARVSLILILLAVSLESAAHAANAPARLATVWRVSLVGIDKLLLTRDGTTAIVAGSAGVGAYAVNDGHLLWQKSSLQAPIALAGDRLIASDHVGALVAIDPATGRVLWTARRQWIAPYIGASDAIVLVSPATSESETRLIALNAATGATLWDAPAGEGIGETIDVLPNVIVLSYAAGEPHFDWTELHDRYSGKTLARYRSILHTASLFERTLWLSESSMTWDGDRNSPAVEFERYDATTGKSLPNYAYKPEPLAPSPYFYQDFDSAVPVVLTSDAVYFQNGKRLYRYSRSEPPEKQHPAGSVLDGKLEAVIGPDVAILSEGSRLTVAIRASSGFVQHEYDLSAQMPKPTITLNGHVFPSGGVHVMAADSQVAYANAAAGAPGWLLAIARRGAFVADQAACSQPSTVALLQDGDAIAVCASTLVRVSFRI